MSDNSAVCRFLCRLAETPLVALWRRRCCGGGGAVAVAVAVLWRMVAYGGGGGAVAVLWRMVAAARLLCPRPRIYRKIEPRLIPTGQVIL